MEFKHKNMDDLEYLSQLGFEKMPVSDKDITELKRKIKTRTFTYKNGFKIGLISFMVGGLIGMGLFFIFYGNQTPSGANLIKSPGTIDARVSENQFTPVALDTVSIVHENFIKPGVNKIEHKDQPVATSRNTDSVEVLQPKQALITPPSESIRQEKIKFITNSTIIYLHDLKVSDYRKLYFAKDQFVKLTGLSADYSDRQNASNTGSRLKQSADYFLHEEISQALLFFKQKKYDQCINSLNLVSEYNKKDINCNFYLGLSYYYKRNYKKAMDNLEKCINNSNNAFYQEALFYKALALLESGKREEALVLLKQIADEGEFYSVKAKEYLK